MTGLNRDWPKSCAIGPNCVRPESCLAWIVSIWPESCILGLNRAYSARIEMGLNRYRPESWLAWIMSGLSRGAWVMSGLNRAYLAWIKMGLNRDRPESWPAWIVSGLNRPAWIVWPESCRPESAGLNQMWIIFLMHKNNCKLRKIRNSTEIEKKAKLLENSRNCVKIRNSEN